MRKYPKNANYPVTNQCYDYPVFMNTGVFNSIVYDVKMFLLKRYKGESICFVGRGSSCTAIACALIQHNANWSYALVRKPNETQHTSMKVHNGDKICDADVVMFIDDQVASGRTLIQVAEEVNKETNRKLDATLMLMQGNIPRSIWNDFKEDGRAIPEDSFSPESN